MRNRSLPRMLVLSPAPTQRPFLLLMLDPIPATTLGAQPVAMPVQFQTEAAARARMQEE